MSSYLKNPYHPLEQFGHAEDPHIAPAEILVSGLKTSEYPGVGRLERWVGHGTVASDKPKGDRGHFDIF